MIVAVIAMLLAIVFAAWWALRDYRAWIALGPGGLPHTVAGWRTMTMLRLRKRDAIGTSIYALFGDARDDPCFLEDLPKRSGPRPTVAPWPIPHRQLDQFASTAFFQKLAKVFDAAVIRDSKTVEYRLSFYEKHNQAVTLRDYSCGHPHARLGQGEIAHIHPSDGSMHMIVSSGDAKRIIEQGWGERHPLAGVRPRLPTTYLYIYPPRDDLELAVVEQILDAAIRHMSAPLKTAFICARAVSTAR